MIRSLRLVNFKCFADTGRVALAPLTLVFGKNNSGKSSILQSLLLLRQSLDAGIGPRVNLDGPLFAAGSYSDLVHQHQSKHHVEMELALGDPTSPDYHDLAFEFCADEPKPPRVVRVQTSGSRMPTVAVRRGRGAGGPFELFVDDVKKGRASTSGYFYSEGFLPLVFREVATTKEAQQPDPRLGARRAFRALEAFLYGMRSVTAFRPQPQRRYDYKGILPGLRDIGGENIITALIEDGLRRRGGRRLILSVNRWLKLVGRVQLMPIRRLSRRARLFELRIRDTDSGRWANFADVGSGIGQALPVLVEGLRTAEGGTLLVQEPEIHLHPDAQLAMADFLVDLVKAGKQVIAETHSENLLLRVRNLVANASKRKHPDLTTSDVRVLYVDKNPDGRSHVRDLAIDSLGQLVGWPSGFMEEATEERLALMSAMAEKSKP